MDLQDFSKVFHRSSKNHSNGHPPIPADSNEWPDEWKTTYYKSYPRLPKIDLDDNPSALFDAARSKDFFELIKKRQSRRDFTRGVITKQELSLILKYSCGNTGELGEERHRRAQPSGGGRFPIEAYPIVFRSSCPADPTNYQTDPTHPADSAKSHGDELKAGLYHYNVKDHRLDVLWDREFTPPPERESSKGSAAGANSRLVRGFSDEEIGKIFTYPWVKNAAVGIVLTSVFWRNQNKYGERGYRYILLEAGHIAQNMYLASEALGLKCCALGGTRDEELEKLLDIDGVTESVVYGLAIGK